jgi:tetratricopeptide (TPR) repeat protein
MLRGLWQEAARLTYGGDLEQAYDLINEELRIAECSIWRRRTQDLGKYLYAIDRRWRSTQLDDGAYALIHLDCPEVAIEYLEELEKKKGKLGFSHSIYLSRGFLETGEYEKAKELIQSLISEGASDNWKERLNGIIEEIDGLLTSEGDNPWCVGILREDLNWCRNRLSPIIGTWQCGQDLEHLKTLASLFKSSGDTYGHNLVLRMIAKAEVSGVSESESAEAILELAGKAHKAKNYEEAIELWEQIESDCKNTSAWLKAVLNIGKALKEQKKFDDAIKQFEKLLTCNASDMEHGSNIIQAWRNCRADAQWEIANCLFAKGDYSGALAAYQASEKKYAFHSCCGNWARRHESRCAVYRGLCLEHLGRYDEAVETYFGGATQQAWGNSTMCIRIVDLYQSANQVETLMRVLGEIDIYRRDKAIREHGSQIVEDPDFDEHMFTRTMRRILEIRALGKKEDVSALVELVVTASPKVHAHEYRDRVTHCDAIEAAKVLAQHPDEAVRRLKAKMSGDNRDKHAVLDYRPCVEIT